MQVEREVTRQRAPADPAHACLERARAADGDRRVPDDATRETAPTPQAPDFIRSVPIWKAREPHSMIALARGANTGR